MFEPLTATTTGVVLTLIGGVFGCTEKGLSLLQKFPFASPRPRRILIELAAAQRKKKWWNNEAHEAIDGLYIVLESCQPHARRILKEMLIRRVTLLSGVIVLAVTALAFTQLFSEWYISLFGLVVAFVVSNKSLDIAALRDILSSQDVDLQKLSDLLNEQIKVVKAALAELGRSRNIFYNAVSRIKQLIGFAGTLESNFLDAYIRLNSTVAAIEMRQLMGECGESMTSLRSYLNDEVLGVACDTIVALVETNKIKAKDVNDWYWETDQMRCLHEEFRKVGLECLLEQQQFENIWKADLYTLIKGTNGSATLLDQFRAQDKTIGTSLGR